MKRAIPQVPKAGQPRDRFDEALKEVLEYIAGQRGTKIGRLADSKERWADLLSDIDAGRLVGPNAPTYADFVGTIPSARFSATAMNEVSFKAHIPHDWKPGTPIYPHVHWSTTGTDLGVVRFGLEYSAARGHSRGAFPVPTTIYLEQAYPGQIGGRPTHVITETSDAAAILTDQLEPDALILFRLFRDAAHVNDTQTQPAFIFFADCHYQSDENQTTTRFPVNGVWTKNTDGHANSVIDKINEILDLLQ